MTYDEFSALFTALSKTEHTDVGIVANETTLASLFAWLQEHGVKHGTLEDFLKSRMPVVLLEVDDIPDYVVDVVCACRVCSESGTTPDYATSPVRVHHRLAMRDGTLSEVTT